MLVCKFGRHKVNCKRLFSAKTTCSIKPVRKKTVKGIKPEFQEIRTENNGLREQIHVTELDCVVKNWDKTCAIFLPQILSKSYKKLTICVKQIQIFGLFFIPFLIPYLLKMSKRS